MSLHVQSVPTLTDASAHTEAQSQSVTVPAGPSHHHQLQTRPQRTSLPQLGEGGSRVQSASQPDHKSRPAPQGPHCKKWQAEGGLNYHLGCCLPACLLSSLEGSRPHLA